MDHKESMALLERILSLMKKGDRASLEEALRLSKTVRPSGA